ncbi:succinate-semialdehyde dehydrogenase (plasmid) [Fulvitalea axinellae]|uniref:Succinate-semialdehyde dehydrogenase n=1 Tax=Fulvitalea axinellae TaxID=1182444 RepID=A0AAU9CL19_9BACT|nr:succinate-semialdehyde dehydrogenase [Fulvitalea axinellae]
MADNTKIVTVNPATGEEIAHYDTYDFVQVNEILAEVDSAWEIWKKEDLCHRRNLLRRLGEEFRSDREYYAKQMTLEMGKIRREALAEIDKVAMYCDFYADKAEEFLADEHIPVAGAQKSYVRFEPLGPVLAVMPWNFPFWQVMRFAVPNTLAGNVTVLKHAAEVTGCALLLEEAFKKAGFPENIFRTLVIRGPQVKPVIESSVIRGVTLTGSVGAGSSVATICGRSLKKSVMELGGSDAFIVLEDVDMDACAPIAFKSRFANNGQVCISAKRFLVHEDVYDAFVAEQKILVESLHIGDPLLERTDYGPMSKLESLEQIERQVKESIALGAKLVAGGHRLDMSGFYYAPTILADVTPDMPVFREETFGPVMTILKVKDEKEAVRLANDSPFGLGGNVWTTDIERGQRVAAQIETGSVFVNSFTQSIPALPFGGTKLSGYGREMSSYGIKEFMNAKTIFVAE